MTASLVLAAAVFVASGLLALVSALRLGRSMALAATRMVVQLFLVGFVLRWAFAHDHWPLTVVLLAVMLAAATLETAARPDRRFRGAWRWLTAGLPLTASTLGVVLVATAPQPYAARTLVPLTGIVLGSAMNAASLALNHFFDAVARERGALEARLALGLEAREALRDLVRRATRAGLIPSLNQMAGAGVITLPGIMTGQLLAGVDPLTAAEYQVTTMFLLAAGSFFAAFGASRLAAARCTDDRDRLRLDHLEIRS